VIGLTINELLALVKAVRERVNGLKGLRSQLSTKEHYFSMGNENKTIEPQYSVVEVDRKVTDLEMFLFKADAAIKQANAVTEIAMEVNVEKLLEPLK
jgi:hypothetical protein